MSGAQGAARVILAGAKAAHAAVNPDFIPGPADSGDRWPDVSGDVGEFSPASRPRGVHLDRRGVAPVTARREFPGARWNAVMRHGALVVGWACFWLVLALLWLWAGAGLIGRFR